MTDKEYDLYSRYCRALNARRKMAWPMLRDAMEWERQPGTPWISSYTDFIYDERGIYECEDLADLIILCEDLERYINDCTMKKLSENIEVIED